MANQSRTSIYQIEVTLMGSNPPIWRRILAASDTTLPDVHELLQISMGWEDSHLHQFVVGEQFFGVADPDFPSDITDEMGVPLADILTGEEDAAVYEYDFGDSWAHRLVLEKIFVYEEGVPLPRCIEGQRACPPEDCGGVPGYEHLLAAIAEPGHPEHEGLSEWLGQGFDPEYLDLSWINFELGEFFGRDA